MSEKSTSSIGAVNFSTSPIEEVDFSTSSIGEVDFSTSSIGEVDYLLPQFRMYIFRNVSSMHYSISFFYPLLIRQFNIQHRPRGGTEGVWVQDLCPSLLPYFRCFVFLSLSYNQIYRRTPYTQRNIDRTYKTMCNTLPQRLMVIGNGIICPQPFPT